MFKVTIEEVVDNTSVSVVRYTQTVDEIDMLGVMAAVNKKPRAPRVDKGKSRKADA